MNGRLEQLERLAVAAATMRAAQREYFRSRSPIALEASKRAEREVDALLKAVLDCRQQSLFSEP